MLPPPVAFPLVARPACSVPSACQDQGTSLRLLHWFRASPSLDDIIIQTRHSGAMLLLAGHYCHPPHHDIIRQQLLKLLTTLHGAEHVARTSCRHRRRRARGSACTDCRNAAACRPSSGCSTIGAPRRCGSTGDTASPRGCPSGIPAPAHRIPSEVNAQCDRPFSGHGRRQIMQSVSSLLHDGRHGSEGCGWPEAA